MKRPSIFIVLFLLSMTGAMAFSTVGLSKVDFSSNDPQLSGPAWLLTVVENGNGQYAVGTIDNQQITGKDGSYAKQDLKIELENTQNTCQYALTNSNVPIYNLEYRPASFWSAEDQCKSTPGCIMTWRPAAAGAVFDVFNVIRTPSANANPLGTPTTLTSTSIKLSAAGETASATITNSGARSTKVGTRAYAEWQGNLVSGGQCPNPLDSGVIGIKQDGNFFIANKASYDQYNPNQDDLLTCFNRINRLIDNGKTEGQKCVDAYNAKTKAVLTKTAIASFANASISSDANGNGQALILLSNNVQFPQISMRVSADWLGIYLPVGKPKIQSISDCSFTEGSTANVQAVVRNDGDAKGSFSVGITCQNAAAQLGTSNTISVNPGQTGTVPLTVTGQAKTTTTTASCTFTATDFNNPDNKDSKTFTCTIKPQAICQANAARCVDNEIQNCNNEGSAWVKQETCLNGCTAQDGKPICQNAEVCSTDSQCDDHDDTTVDQCVGVVSRQCKHVVIPGEAQQPQGSIPLKLIGFGVALVVFAIVTYFLATNGLVLPAVGTGILTVAALIGLIIGAFSVFSVLSAWLITIAMIALLIGLASFEYLPEVAGIAFIVALLFLVLGVMLFFTCTNPGIFLKTIGVCS